jgi:predicted nucleic acid-binding Zn ribbon protein
LSEASLRSSKPQSVGEILARLVKKTGLGRRLEQAKIWEHWPEIAGPSLYAHGRPHSIKDKTLTVEVDSTVWMNKYAYFKWDILKRANLLAGKELVSDVFFVLAPDEEARGNEVKGA